MKVSVVSVSTGFTKYRLNHTILLEAYINHARAGA